jgi:DNA invertase Pin-like site-specific DNA recombinase
MSNEELPVVVYGCKSSPDEKESIPDQHRLVLAAIEAEGGRRLIAEPFGEANASGYRKERGPQLEAAIRSATDAAGDHGEAELWVFHSSRLARGDGRKGKRSIQLVVAQLLYDDVVVRSVADPEMVTPMLAGIASKVAHQYAADLSAHTKRGVNKRRAEGKPVGGMGLGYAAEAVLDDAGKPVMRGNRVVTTRVVDPAGKLVVQALFDGLDRGLASGAVARKLNLAGHRTAPGKEFNARAVREIARNAVYAGSGGYPPVIERDQWERVQDKLRRDDNAAQAHKRGGRPRLAEYMLKRLVFCGDCGRPMYCITRKSGRNGDGPLKRLYQCSAQVESRGSCQAHYVPADLAESRILEHLKLFVGDVEGWIAERLSERSAEHEARRSAVDAAKATLAVMDVRRDKLFAEYQRLVDESDPLARYALEPVSELDTERDTQERAIGEAEAALSEFTGEADADAVLDFYNGLRDLVTGKIAKAQGVAEINAVLHDHLTGIWLRFDGATLDAQVKVRMVGQLADVTAELFEDVFAGREPWIYAYQRELLEPQPETINLGSRFRSVQPPCPS